MSQLSTLKRIGTTLAAGLLALSALVPSATFAAGWTDISSNLSPRQNRPVWAMAYGNPYWYFTDGQELYTGGHVWRTDGAWSVDITNEVRKAGLNRVDDIVSDGKTVVYLKNVVGRRNNVEMLSYTPATGAYGYPANAIMSRLNWDEGIASIVGNGNGSWAFVTTNGRVFTWNMETGTGTQIRGASAYAGSILYSVRHDSPADGYTQLPVAVVPVSNGWLITSYENGQVRAYVHNGYALNDVTSAFGTLSEVRFIASNGSTALVAGTTYNYGYTTKVIAFDGATGVDVTASANNAAYNFNWSKAIAAGDVSGFFVTSDKQVLRYTVGTRTFERQSDSTDLFLTVDGARDGRFLFGGVASNAGSAQPSNPLTAKLVKAEFWSTGTTGSTGVPTGFGGGRTASTSYGPTLVTMGSPSTFRVANGQTFVYRATATDPQGIDRIDLYVNNVRVKTCNDAICDFESTYYTNGASLRTVTLYARATDKSGWSTETPSESLTVDLNGTGTGTTTGNGNNAGSVSGWFSNGNSLRTDQTTTFTANASDMDGIQRIEVFVNGNLVKACDGLTGTTSNSCVATLNGWNYTAGQTLSVSARVTDAYGYQTWSSTNSLSVVNPGYNSGNGTISGSLSSTVLPKDGTLTYTVNAYPYGSVGLDRVEIYLDGALRKTCPLYGSANTATCTETFSGANYADGSSHTVQAKSVDIYGSAQWTSGRSFQVGYVNSGSNAAGSITASVSPTQTLELGKTGTFTAMAYDATGIDTVKLYVNGELKKTCSGYNASALSCSMDVVASSWPAYQDLFLNAVVIDRDGQQAWSSGSSLRIVPVSTTNGGSGGNTSGPQGTISVSADKSTYSSTDTVTFTATASQATTIDILVNAVSVKTCQNATTCSYVGGPYGTLKNVSYAARMTDGLYGLWTGYRTVSHK